MGLITAVVGLILGIMGKKKALEYGASTGMATAGIIMSVIAIAISILVVVACIACMATIGSYSTYW